MVDFKFKFIIPAIFIILLLSVKITFAGSCVLPALDESIKDSADIAVLKLQSVEKYGKNQPGHWAGEIKQSRFTVEKKIKGNLKVGQEIVFAGWDSTYEDASYRDDLIGTEFLFYLDSRAFNHGRWHMSDCSRSDLVKNAVADLFYFDKMKQVAGRTRLAGTVAQEIKSAVEGEKTIFTRLAGRNIMISGKGQNITVKTDANGIYEVYDLPAGEYRVTSERIPGYKFNEKNTDFDEINVEKGSINDEDFVYKIDDSISGKFFDTGGQPFKKAHLALIPENGRSARDFYGIADTDKNGVFEITEIPTGTYLLVANILNTITANEPFGTFYYPNKTNRAEAVRITIAPGDHLTGLVVSAPSMAEIVTIRGVLLFEDGKPAAYAPVKFYNGFNEISRIKSPSGDSEAETDQDGKFEMRILKGQKGILFGLTNTFPGRHKTCPKMDLLVKARKNELGFIESRPVPIAADNNSDNVTVKFPFPRCKELYTD